MKFIGVRFFKLQYNIFFPIQSKIQHAVDDQFHSNSWNQVLFIHNSAQLLND